MQDDVKEKLFAIVDDDFNIIECDLSQKEAEIKLCRYCNEEEGNYYLFLQD